MAHLHKKFNDSQVKDFLNRYLKNEIKRHYIQKMLGIGKTRFFTLLKKYKTDQNNFSIQYARKHAPRKISLEIEKNIIKELSIEQKIIKNKEVPLKNYNYSYIKDYLQNKYDQKVSLYTIIKRAKEHGFYFEKKSKKIHDREVLTQYAGELIQHDSSFHLWSPAAKEKWYLITSLDDYSRFILFAMLFKREASWNHIYAMQTMFLKYGCPYQFYVDCHSIFRFVRGRDDIHYMHNLETDDTNPQWKQVLDDCTVLVLYALSPQAKGKIERPYGWLQDRVVRTCVREDVTDIAHAQRILDQEIYRYNYKQVHSTTQEIPYFRFQRALQDKKNLFRKFIIKPPFQSPKDIFCFRISRVLDSYRRISIKNMQFKVHGLPQTKVDIRIYPLRNNLVELRFWFKDKLLNVQRAKSDDLGIVHF